MLESNDTTPMKHRSVLRILPVSFAIIALIATLFPKPGVSGLVAVTRPVHPEMLFQGGSRSHWQAGDGSHTELWIVSQPDGSLEFRGRDSASCYEGLMVLDENDGPGTYQRIGTGFRFVDGSTFAYQSTVKLVSTDKSARLEEAWTAIFSSGEKIAGETTLESFPAAAR